jgi:hypothetical protein
MCFSLGLGPWHLTRCELLICVSPLDQVGALVEVSSSFFWWPQSVWFVFLQAFDAWWTAHMCFSLGLGPWLSSPPRLVPCLCVCECAVVREHPLLWRRQTDAFLVRAWRGPRLNHHGTPVWGGPGPTYYYVLHVQVSPRFKSQDFCADFLFLAHRVQHVRVA